MMISCSMSSGRHRRFYHRSSKCNHRLTVRINLKAIQQQFINHSSFLSAFHCKQVGSISPTKRIWKTWDDDFKQPTIMNAMEVILTVPIVSEAAAAHSVRRSREVRKRTTRRRRAARLIHRQTFLLAHQSNLRHISCLIYTRTESIIMSRRHCRFYTIRQWTRDCSWTLNWP